jgi:dTDP-glucose 4,6-dehydratase
MLETDFKYIQESLNEELSIIQSKKILIIGGTGFFGTNFLTSLKYLIEKDIINCKIDIMSRSFSDFEKTFPDLFEFQNFSFISHDITKVFEIENKYDFVIHSATTASEDLTLTNPLLLLKTSIEGTSNVLDFCLKNNSTLLYISSGAVFGKNYSLNKKFTEPNLIDSLDQNHSYAYGKICAENLCYHFSSQFNLTIKIARCFAFVGPHLPLNSHFAIGNFINNVLKNEKISINTKGKSIRSYLYTSDLIIWLIKVLVVGENLKPYNVGSPYGISVKDLAIKLDNMFKVGLNIDNAYEKPTLYVPNIDDSLSDLNISNIIDLETAINKTIEWNRQ